MKSKFYHSLLWRLLVPVVLVGTITSVLLIYSLAPPLISSTQKRIDRTISHTASMAINICEERLNDMLDLRLEENREMNDASQREAIEEIIELSAIFPNIRMIIIHQSGEIVAASFPIHEYRPEEMQSALENISEEEYLSTTHLFGKKVLLKHQYFPFWRWHLLSYTPEKEYRASIILAKRIVQFGNFGTFLVVVISVILLFLLHINRPLRRIISTTREIPKGNFKRLDMKGKGEIEEVAVAFDRMVDKLDEDKAEIDRIMKDLCESEEKYRILSEHSLALVAVVKNDQFLYGNHATAAFFSIRMEDIAGKEIRSLLTQNHHEILQEKMSLLLQKQSTVEHFELCHISSDEDEKWLEVIASEIPFAGTPSVLIHALDITERKKMEHERRILREKADRGERMEMLGTLAGGVAHDLNNILGGIVGYPELLMQGMEKDDKLYGPLAIIQKSGIKAAAIVQDLLTLTRRGVVVTKTVSVGEIIKEYLDSLEFVKLISFYPKVKVETEIADDLMNISGSPHHISTAIMNLVTNSAEAMPEGGQIHITAENRYIDHPVGDFEDVVEGEYVCITIRDNGEGISQENSSRIFEPFYTKKVMGRSGTGLGMSVVWGVVKDHNGYIELSSIQHLGTIFTLYFPASRERIKHTKKDMPVQNIRGNGESILVVDDVEEQRLIASSMLESLGYSPDVAESGEKAIEMFAKKSYDLVLLDMIMDKGIDGLDTYREMLKRQPQQKAIIASGYSETERVRKTMELGAGAYLKKPYSLEKLAKAIMNELSSRN